MSVVLVVLSWITKIWNRRGQTTALGLYVVRYAIQSGLLSSKKFYNIVSYELPLFNQFRYRAKYWAASSTLIFFFFFCNFAFVHFQLTLSHVSKFKVVHCHQSASAVQNTVRNYVGPETSTYPIVHFFLLLGGSPSHSIHLHLSHVRIHCSPSVNTSTHLCSRTWWVFGFSCEENIS